MPSFVLLTLSFIVSISSCAHRQGKTIDPAEVTRLDRFFEESFEARVARSPEWQTYLGRKSNYGRLDEGTEARALEEHEIDKANLKQLRQFKFAHLDEPSQLSYRIMEYGLEQEIEGFKWRYHHFPINQMFGYQSEVPSFLINMHRVETEDDALAYISRLREIGRVFAENMVFLKKQEDLGIIPPHFVFSKVLDDCQNIITGRPFTRTGESPFLADFKSKLKGLKLAPSRRAELLTLAESALMKFVGPAYEDLMVHVRRLERNHKANLGAWSLPEGRAYYDYALKVSTTTDFNADVIHDIGLREVARIQQEMIAIKNQVGFRGSLQDFFNHLRGPKYHYPDSKAGREAYLSRVNEVVEDMERALPKLFNTFPKASLEVKPVEAFREKSAGTAFYSGPSLEGNRPGIYYVNLYKMADNPIYTLEALAYHEAIPGHHMQISISKEMDHLPKFRRTGGFTAYAEGWGLYAELLPKEIGFYRDPYSDFGRLSMEIWRAVRLVVDTGIHAKKWTREEAIKYMSENTPNAELETTKEIERYFIMPGQATAYKIGMLKLLELREKAKLKLGDRFDIREFHDLVLRDGALPLSILEERVARWVSRQTDPLSN